MVANPDRRARQGLLLACSCLYLLCTSGQIFTPDGVLMLRVTQSLVDRHEVAVDDLPIAPGSGTTQTVTKPDGTSVKYAKYGIGLSIAAIPTYAIGHVLLPWVSQSQRSLFQIPET